MTLNVYTTNMKKRWIGGLSPSLFITFFALLLLSMWPEFKNSISNLEELMKSNIYKAMMGEELLAMGFGTFQSFYAMEIFTTVNFFVIFIAVFQAGSIVSKEADSNTLDLLFSYPIKRWWFVLQRYLTYATYTLMYPIATFLIALLGASILNEELNRAAFFQAQIAMWLQFLTAGSIALLMSAIFLSPEKSYGVSGAILLIMYFAESLGTVVDSLNWARSLSIFHYASPGVVLARNG
ncbi:MAG: ABC transporter permease, partial [Deltaproteobacteria bacterium]|nr:ABC transporter permease [Deltaproteobacteria bacterium]